MDYEDIKERIFTRDEDKEKYEKAKALAGFYNDLVDILNQQEITMDDLDRLFRKHLRKNI